MKNTFYQLALVLLFSSGVFATDITYTDKVGSDASTTTTFVAADANEIKTAVNSKQNRVTGIAGAGEAIQSINADGSVNSISIPSISQTLGGGSTTDVPSVAAVDGGLALKQDLITQNTVETHVENFMNSADQAAARAAIGAASSASSGYVTTPTYSDEPCTVGQRSFDASYLYRCEATDQWDRFAVTWLAWDNPSDNSLTMAITDTTGTGSTFTVNSEPATVADTPKTWAGLSSATEAVTFAANSTETSSCTGTGVTGSDPNWIVDMSSADVTDMACTVSAASGATDWTADSSAQALYSFEAADQAGDSVNTNDLTEINSGTIPTNDTTNYQELSASAAFTPSGTDAAYFLAQADAGTSFPANGTTSSEITIGGWFRITTFAGGDFLFGITDDSTGSGSEIFGVQQYVSNGNLAVRLNGVAIHESTTDVLLNGWYFVAITFSDTNDEVMLYLRSEDGSTLYEYATTAESTETALDDMTSSGGFGVGCTDANNGTTFYGNLDGIAAFSRTFTKTELDSVFTNGWDGDGW